MKRTFSSMCGFGPRAYDLQIDGTLHNYVNNNRPRAVMALSNWFGIAVWMDAASGDECVAAWSNGDSYSGAHRHAIHYSGSGRAYEDMPAGTTLLVVGSKPGMKKMDKADKWIGQVRKVTEAQFLAMFAA